MNKNKGSISRRNFLKTAGAVGAGSLLSSFASLSDTDAKSNFNEIPLNVRKRVAYIDYKESEKKCPQRLEIGRLMREATTELV